MAVSKVERKAIELQTLNHLMSLLDTAAIAKVYVQVIDKYDPTWAATPGEVQGLIEMCGMQQAEATGNDWDAAVKKIYEDERAERDARDIRLHEMAEMARTARMERIARDGAK